MPLPSGKLLASAETQANVSEKFEQAMRDLALKAERQKLEKARKEEEQKKQEYLESLDAPRKQRLEFAKNMHGGGSINSEIQKQADEEEARILDEDPELDILRQQRIERLRKLKSQTQDNLAKGHGKYEEIVEDEFLKTVLKSKFCLCHFYHKDFDMCKLMDKHLEILARDHVETKFIKINAEKTPFFVEKLKVRTLPTVVLFMDGKSIDTLVGFDGMMNAKKDDIVTRALEERIGMSGCIKMERAFYEPDFESKAMEGEEKTFSILSTPQNDSDDDSDW
mmetsp:Transcript_13062/g.15218  ORF Transcript_13062/g.15218 Transcript_13062/m.15218 type:complete len:280 (+) Transcript_13062:158-997(+)